jgi:hypothetical protein
MKKILKNLFSGRHKIMYLLGALIGLVNPLLQPLVGDIGFMVLKVAGALLCALILWDVHRRFPRVGLIATSVAVAGYAVIVIWNTSLFLLA